MIELNNGEKKFSIADHILIILKENNNNGNKFLTNSDIAIRVMSRILGMPGDNQYGKVIQPKTIQSLMGEVRKLADEEGITIIADRRNPKTREPSKIRISGWRIATEGDDEYIRKEIELRAERRDSYESNREKIQSTAEKSKLLPKGSNTYAKALSRSK